MLKGNRMNHLTFKQYRNIDLSIIAVLLIVSEYITTVATKSWFSFQAVAISTSFLFILIGMMRWSLFAVIYPIIGGAVFCFALGEEPKHYLIYMLGNCFALLALLWFKAFKKDDVRKSPAKLTLFIFTAYVAMQLGRWLVSLIFSLEVWNLVGFLTADIISLLFAVVVMFILRGTDGMIEDQKAYLFRLERERKEELERQLSPTGYGTED